MPSEISITITGVRGRCRATRERLRHPFVDPFHFDAFRERIRFHRYFDRMYGTRTYDELKRGYYRGQNPDPMDTKHPLDEWDMWQ